MENELLAAEIYLAPVNTKEATAEIDRELDTLEKRIQNFTVRIPAKINVTTTMLL